MKEFLREILIFFHFDISKNIEYDRLTRKILKNALKNDSSGIDVGCHKGEILDDFIKYAPKGRHIGFEPIPYLFDNLKVKYKNKAKIFPYALADEDSILNFNYVKSSPAYSGLKKRTYKKDNEEIEEIQVQVKKLDDVVGISSKVDLIKIDVEGAEFGVLKGAKDILKTHQPMIIFEFGLGASDYYDTTPDDIYQYLVEELGYSIYTLKSFINNQKGLSKIELNKLYLANTEYYFVASV